MLRKNLNILIFSDHSHFSFILHIVSEPFLHNHSSFICPRAHNSHHHYGPWLLWWCLWPLLPVPRSSLVDPSESDSYCTPPIPVSIKSIFAPLGLSKNTNINDKLTFSPQLYSSRNNFFAPTSNLANATCDKETEYFLRLRFVGVAADLIQH